MIGRTGGPEAVVALDGCLVCQIPPGGCANESIEANASPEEESGRDIVKVIR